MHRPINHIMFYETRCLVEHPSFWSILQLHTMRGKESIILTHNENVQSKFTRLTVYDSNKIIVGEPNLFIYLIPTEKEQRIWCIEPWTKWLLFCIEHFQLYFIEKINQTNKPFLCLYSFTFLEDPTDNMSALIQLNTSSSLKPLPQLMLIPVTNWYSCHYILMI